MGRRLTIHASRLQVLWKVRAGKTYPILITACNTVVEAISRPSIPSQKRCNGLDYPNFTSNRTCLRHPSKPHFFTGAMNTLALLDHLLLWTGLTMHRNRKQQPLPPKAWQGPNPITQKGSTVIANGTEKPLPKLPSSQSQTKSTTESSTDKHAYDRALYMIASFTVRNPERTMGLWCDLSKTLQSIIRWSTVAGPIEGVLESSTLTVDIRDTMQH